MKPMNSHMGSLRPFPFLPSHVPSCRLVRTLRPVLARLLMSKPWCPDALCRGWEFHTHAIFKHNWAVGLRNARMHQGTVPVAIDMCLKALLRTVPRCLTDVVIVTVARPIGETFKVLQDIQSAFMRRQVQKCVSQANFGVESRWQVKEVIPPCEAFSIQ